MKYKKCLLLLFIVFVFNLYPQNVTPPTAPTPPEINNDGNLSNNGNNKNNFSINSVSSSDSKQVMNTISYGLDSDVISVVKNLKRSGDASYNSDLLKRLSSTFNIDLKKEILDFFVAVGYSGANETASYILDNYESKRYSLALVISAIEYLKELGDKDTLKKSLLTILENKEGNIVSSSAYYLGELNAKEYAKEIMEVYEKYSGNDGVKSAILIALGKMKASEYEEQIYNISLDSYESSGIRAAAIEALSYLSPNKITEHAEEYLQNNNKNMKTSVISSLSRDSSVKSKDILQEFLRDNDENIRIQAVRAIKGHKDAGAKDVLVYKSKNDPSSKVREEAAKSLVEIGAGDKEVRDIILNSTSDNNFKITIFSYILERNPNSALEIALEFANKENIDKPSNTLKVFASILATKKGNFDNFYSKIIDSKDLSLQNFAIRGAVYNKSSGLTSKLKEIKRTTSSEAVKTILKDY